MQSAHMSRRGAGGRVVFWMIALVIIGGLVYTIYTKKKPPVSDNKPPADQLAAFLAAHHKRAWEQGADDAFSVKAVEGMYASGKVWFGQDVPFDEVAGSGLTFQGAGEMSPAIPGPAAARSAHVRFETDGTKGPKGLRSSMFMQKYLLESGENNEPVFKIRTSYTLEKDASLGAPAPDILVYRQGGIIYYLVTEQPGGYDLVKEAFKIPDPSGPY